MNKFSFFDESVSRGTGSNLPRLDDLFAGVEGRGETLTFP